MSTDDIVATPTALLAAIGAAILLLLAGSTAEAAILDPNGNGFGGRTRSANYDELLDAMYSSGNTTTTIPTGNGAMLWVPWFSSSSQCTESALQRGNACDAGTIDFEHNCMVSDELSQVGVLVAMGSDQSRMDEYYNTLLATRSTNGRIPAWRVYRNGDQVEACKPGVNGNCDTASDATARMIISLYTAASNERFADQARKQQYRSLADALAADFVTYEVVDSCRPSTLGHGDICHWLAAGSGAKRGGMQTIDFTYTGYYPDATIAMLQACANTGESKYCAVAGNFTLNYLQAADFDGSTFSVPPGRSFRWIDVNGVPTAQCTHNCNPLQWDTADAPRATAMCQANYYAETIGYDLPLLDEYCALWESKHMANPRSAPIQYTPDGNALGYVNSYFSQGLQALFYTGANQDLFEQSLDAALDHYSTSTRTFDWTACFGVYHQAFPMRALGVGIGRNEKAFPQLTERQAPACTPSTEVCDQRDNDCDGQVDENSVCGSQSCATSISAVPVSCSGGTITQDSTSGSCRTVVCSGSGSSMQALACDKGNYFEAYRQQRTGTAVSSICFGSACVGSSGFAKSADYPLCTTTAPPPPTCSPSSEVCDQRDNDCDGQVDEGSVCTPTNTCYGSVKDIPVSCTGTITSDGWNGCRTVLCSSGSGSIKTLACDKGNYFEVYKQGSTGSAPQVCFGSTCISTAGYAKSGSFPLCTAAQQPSSAQAPLSVRVTASQVGNAAYTFACVASGFVPTSYEWQFGDGNAVTGSEPTVSHKYNGYGSYLVQCFARNSAVQANNSTRVDTAGMDVAPVCATSISGLPARCDGGTITLDSTSGSCRTVVCSGSGSSMQALACDKGNYFEMYRQSKTGTAVSGVCLGGTCVGSSGFAKSADYPLCG